MGEIVVYRTVGFFARQMVILKMNTKDIERFHNIII
jgi:hypothetical protein